MIGLDCARDAMIAFIKTHNILYFCVLYIYVGIRREEQVVEAHRELKREKNRQKLDSYVPQTLGMCDNSLVHLLEEQASH